MGIDRREFLWRAADSLPSHDEVDEATLHAAVVGQSGQEMGPHRGAHVRRVKSPKDFDEPQGLPTTYLIAPDGTVAKRFIGPIDASVLGHAIPAGK